MSHKMKFISSIVALTESVIYIIGVSMSVHKRVCCKFSSNGTISTLFTGQSELDTGQSELELYIAGMMASIYFQMASISPMNIKKSRSNTSGKSHDCTHISI